MISPKKDCKELEDIVTLVNDQKTELNTIAETAIPSHLVKLAGFRLPVAPPLAVVTGKRINTLFMIKKLNVYF